MMKTGTILLHSAKNCKRIGSEVRKLRVCKDGDCTLGVRVRQTTGARSCCISELLALLLGYVAIRLPSVIRGVGQNIVFHASPAAGSYAFPVCAFTDHSASFLCSSLSSMTTGKLLLVVFNRIIIN